MKKLLFLMLILSASLSASAQGIYTSIVKYDKFDDVEWKKNKKTLITQTDTTFIIETKGSEPVIYYYNNAPLFATHVGHRDSLANLVADVWGYESMYYAIPKETIDKYVSELRENNQELHSTKISEMLPFLFLSEIFEKGSQNGAHYITVRNVSKFRYTYEYSTDIFWIMFSDGSRIIYLKDVY